MYSKNKGMLLESLINKTINFYKINGVGIFHKKEIPISFKKVIEKDGLLHAKEAFITKKSTTDYYGIWDGNFIAFQKFDEFFYLPINKIKKIKGNNIDIKEVRKIGTKIDLIYPGIIDFIAILKKQ